MDIVISNSSGKPIYEQITSQIKAAIMQGVLKEGDQLPSIRALANSLGVSVITTKRAYSDLEDQGFLRTVQGKGSFVAGGNAEMLREERLKRIESHLASALDEAASAGVSLDEIHGILDALALD
ncbi:MAG: GntR family transcriptional regulator [Coriobacteriia bacterium]|nr:GntR family transcriptional regulator [Coriobacteriia bacterium]